MATQVYEKGTQNLADAIREVEKLQAAYQLTATLLPSSSVNFMFSEDDKCFQCQESGHLAYHWTRIKCFNCDEYSHVAADCPDKIPPSGTPAWHRNHHSSMRHHTRSTSCHNHRDKHRFNRSRSHSCSHRYRNHSQSNSQRSHSRSYHRCPHRVPSCPDTQTLIAIDRTHHIGDLHHTEALLHNLVIAVGLNHIPYTKLLIWHLLNPPTALTGQLGNTRIRNINKSPLMIPLWIITVLMNHLSNAPHEWGGLSMAEIITITVHAGKHYKALIDSGATISLLRYSTYKKLKIVTRHPYNLLQPN